MQALQCCGRSGHVIQPPQCSFRCAERLVFQRLSRLNRWQRHTCSANKPQAKKQRFRKNGEAAKLSASRTDAAEDQGRPIAALLTPHIHYHRSNEKNVCRSDEAGRRSQRNAEQHDGRHTPKPICQQRSCGRHRFNPPSQPCTLTLLQPLTYEHHMCL